MLAVYWRQLALLYWRVWVPKGTSGGGFERKARLRFPIVMRNSLANLTVPNKRGDKKGTERLWPRRIWICRTGVKGGTLSITRNTCPTGCR